jgi:hypothetical protein
MIPLNRFTASENFGRLGEGARRPFLALAREEAERRVLSFTRAKSHRPMAKSRRGDFPARVMSLCANGEITATRLSRER